MNTTSSNLSFGAQLNKAFSRAHKRCQIPSKEWYENREFFEIARRRFRAAGIPTEFIIDIGGGHGIGAMLWLAYGSSSHATIIDERKPKSFAVLLEEMQTVTDFESPTYIEKRFPPKDLAIHAGQTIFVGLHCCGAFSDAVIDCALRLSCPLALVPCCHELDDTSLLTEIRSFANRKRIDPDAAIDLQRAGRLVQAGWRVWLDTLSENITPKNTVIIAAPRR